MAQNAAASPNNEAQVSSARAVGVAVCVAAGLLMLGEIALQIRAHVRMGESVFSLMLGRTTYVRHPSLDIRILRPSSVIGGSKQVIKSNRFGLRNEEFDPRTPPGETRIALLGASSVLGTYAPTNADTSSTALERLLNATPSPHRFRVVNAGLGGTTIHDQSTILAEMLPNLGISLVIWYPGSNDIGCRANAADPGSNSIRLPWPGLPSWVVSGDMIVKNTAWVRRGINVTHTILTPSFDIAATRSSIDRGISMAREQGLSVVLVTAATSFRSSMEAEVIAKRASSALFFRPCYSGPELAAAIDALNDLIRGLARERHVPLIDAANLMPPELHFFGDASHFSVTGEQAFASLLNAELHRQNLLTAGLTP